MEVVPINSFIDEFNYLASFERLKYVSPRSENAESCECERVACA
jgi:hypothetical protein